MLHVERSSLALLVYAVQEMSWCSSLQVAMSRTGGTAYDTVFTHTELHTRTH